MSVFGSMRSSFTSLRKKGWFMAILCVCLFALGLCAGWLIANYPTSKAPVVTPVHDPDSGYTFINPVLYTESSEALSFPKYTPLQNALQQYVSSAEKSGSATSIGIYYRDMNANNWIGINQSQQYDPASMMKVATLVALLRASETQPKILSLQISIPASITLPNAGIQDYYPPADPVKGGNTYTIPNLMQRLIEQSDNGADAVLIDYLGNTAMATVYGDLDLPTPGTTTGISPQTYSHLFRVLYNATYLNASDSEEALNLLSQTNFTAGLVAGVPTGTVVAHKFGESMDAPNAPGLDDCGIVYYPGDPYFLCVMTKGSSFNTLAGVIKNISSITWQQISTLNTTK